MDKNGKAIKQLDLHDNGLAARLFGEGGENIKRFEKNLGVEIKTRGTLVNISGEPGKVELARRLIAELYALLEKGYPLYSHDLEYALRMLMADKGAHLSDVFMDTVFVTFRKKVIAPKSVAQKAYVDAIRRHDIVFGIGPAGTGKTYLAMAMAVAALTSKQVDRVILTRPAVGAGGKLGFLPGAPGRKPSSSPASTAGRVSITRSTCLLVRAATAMAIARYVFPVPAGPMPKTMSCLLMAST